VRTLTARMALALAIAAVACDRGAPPPARTVAASTTAPPTAPAVDTAPRWLEPRRPGDRCRRASGEDDRPHPSSPSGGVAHEDLSHGVAFDCTLREGHLMRLVLEGDDYGWPAAVLVYDPPGAAVPADTLKMEEAEPPYAGATLLEGEDLNGDGWTDVRVMTFHGSGGRMFDVFRYVPSRHRFEKDTVLSGEGNVRRVGTTPCARISWSMGVGNWSWMDRCWRDGRWVVTRAEHRTQDYALSTRDVMVFVHEKTELRGGRMRVVSSDTVRGRIR